MVVETSKWHQSWPGLPQSLRLKFCGPRLCLLKPWNDTSPSSELGLFPCIFVAPSPSSSSSIQIRTQISWSCPWIHQYFSPPYLQKWPTCTSEMWQVHYTTQMASVCKQRCQKGMWRPLLLILGVHCNLIVSKVSIQEAVISMSRKPLQHLVREKQRKMIFPCGFIELAVVDPYSPTSDSPCWD